MSCQTRADAIVDHKPPRLMEPELLLILKRAHGGKRAKVMMKRGLADTRHIGEFFDLHRPREIVPDVPDCNSDTVGLRSNLCRLPEPLSYRTDQHTIEDLPLHLGGKDWDFFRGVEEIYETHRGSRQGGGHGAYDIPGAASVGVEPC
jgi:hypothetical protein